MDLMKRITRKKYYANSSNEVNTNRLSKSMEIFDLAAIGTGPALGFGVFMLCGHVAHYQAGPAVILSILMAVIVAIFAGLCYSELSARISRAGSSYTYSYILIGELVAFLIAWTLISECIIGAAAMLKGISLFLNEITGRAMDNVFLNVAPMDSGLVLADFFDFFTFGLGILLAIVFAVGMKRSILVANLCFIVTLTSIIYIIITGIFKADVKNWQITTENGAGAGGFSPYGVDGIFSGAATFMFLFIGFESVISFRSVGKKAQKYTNISFFIKLLVTLCAVMGVGMIMTFMFPYHKEQIVNMPEIFAEFGWYVAEWITAITGIICLTICTFETICLMKNILIVLSEDSLVLQTAKVSNTILRTPDFVLFWTIFVIGLVSSLFELRFLINMLSIGVLFAFIMISFVITVIRYSDYDNRYTNSSIDIKSNILMDLFNGYRKKSPSITSMRIVKIVTFIFCLASLGLSILIQTSGQEVLNSVGWVLALLGVFLFLMVLTLLITVLQPRYDFYLEFKIPFVPLLPSISIFVNIYLITCLDMNAWIRFGVWTTLGLALYFLTICLGKPVVHLPVRRDLAGIDNPAVDDMETIATTDDPMSFVTDENGNIIKGRAMYINGKFEEISEKQTTVILQNSVLSESKTDQNALETSLSQNDKAVFKMSQDSLNSHGSHDYITEYNEHPERRISRFEGENLDMILPAPDYPDYESVEVTKTHVTPPFSPHTEEKETRKALDILDDVLNVEDPNLSPDLEGRNLPLNDAINSSPNGSTNAQLVMAVVHRNNETEDEMDNVSTDSYSVVIREEEPAGPLLSFQEFLQQDMSPVDEKPVMPFTETFKVEALKDQTDDQKFKLKLDDIINQKANVYKFDELVEKTDTAKDLPKKLRPSRSESDLAKYLSISGRDLKFDKQTSVVAVRKNPVIPEPPKFDPVLYKSVSNRSKGHRESIDSIINDESAPRSVKVEEETAPIVRSLRKVPAALKLTPVEFDDNNDQPEDENHPLGIAGIKSKLEEILKRGPQNAYHPRSRPYSQPQSLVIPTTPTSTNRPSSTSVASSNSTSDSSTNISDTVKNEATAKRNMLANPTDTVSKQKLLFKDVLKAINPDTKPSDVRLSILH